MIHNRAHINTNSLRDSRCVTWTVSLTTLTSHLIKTFEKLTKEDILMHLQNHNLLNHTQHGFRPGRATISQLLNYHHSIITMLQTSDRVESIYLDFAKAFHKVNHDILRQKLEKHNIKGKLLQWIMTFLSNRK